LLRKPQPKPAPEESKTQEIAKVPIPQPVMPTPNFEDDSKTYFGASKTLRTSAHRKMVLKFVRDKYSRARFQRIYDAETDGWGASDFHRCCDKKGWTLTIVETTKGPSLFFGSCYIFGAFTTAEWVSSDEPISKPCPHSFLFSVNEGSKYPINSGDRVAIECYNGWCARFGEWGNVLGISSDSNNNTDSYCQANHYSFNLPAAKGSLYPSINGGDKNF
jgi:hypothetical protein